MTRVFISYSRKDKVFAGRLTEALQKSELETWIDWEDIPPTADWMDQIHKGIEQADAFLFLLSPDSVASRVCGQEVDHAVQNGKRLIPIVARDVNPNDVHPALAKVNWIYCRESDDFDGAINKTLCAIRTDLAWVEAHRRLQVRAVEWNKRQDVSLLLRGKDLREAEEQFSSSGQKDPQPTDLQRRYILESRRRENKTRNRLLTISGITISFLVILFILAIVQLNKARALVLGSQAQVAFTGENYNLAALYAYQSNQIYNNSPATDILRELPFNNFSTEIALLGHTGVVNSVAWSPDGKLASASDDNTVIVWDLKTRLPGQILRGHTFNVNSVAWSQDGKLASASMDGTIIIWDLMTEKPAQTLAIKDRYITFKSVAWSPGGKLASGSLNGDVIIWDIKTGLPAQILSRHSDSVECVAWSSNGELASASGDHTIIIWNLETGQPSKILKGHKSYVMSVAWSPYGMLASGSLDGTVIIWDPETGQSVGVLKYPKNTFLSVSWAKGGELASAAGDKVILWDLKTGKPSQVLRGHSGNGVVMSIAWSQNGILASASSDNTITLNTLDEENVTHTLNPDGEVVSISWSRDGRLASGDADKVVIWNLHTDLPAQILSGHSDYVTSVAWSRDGKLASASSDKTINIWNLETSFPAIILKGHTDNVSSIAWSQDGRLVSGSLDKTVIIWDQNTGTPSQTLKAHTDNVTAVAWSQDGRLASSSWDYTVIIWDLETSQPARTLKGHTSWVEDVAWSLDGKLASASSDDTIIIWNLETGQPAQILRGQSSPSEIAWSPDGKLASVSSYGTVIIWNLKTGRPDITISQPEESFTDTAWSPDGKLTSVSGIAINIIRDDLLKKSPCQWIFRNMTIDEWLSYQGPYFVYKPACPNLPSPDFNLSIINLRNNPSYGIEVVLITWWGRLIFISFLIIILATLYGVTRVSYQIITRARRRSVTQQTVD